MSDPLRLVVTGEGGSRLAITPLDRPYAESPEPWDRDWIRARAKLQQSAFHGNCEGELRTEDFALFRDSLRRTELPALLEILDRIVAAFPSRADRSSSL